MELVTCDWELVEEGLTRLLGLANLGLPPPHPKALALGE